MIAETDAELRDAQAKFLEERAVRRSSCTRNPDSACSLPVPFLIFPFPLLLVWPLLLPFLPLLIPATLRLQKMRQTYDTDVESTYNSAEEVADKKNIYVTIVGGLIAVAFIAPMLQFFYYTGGD